MAGAFITFSDCLFFVVVFASFNPAFPHHLNDMMTVSMQSYDIGTTLYTVKTLNIGTLRPATIVVLNLKQFNFTMK